MWWGTVRKVLFSAMLMKLSFWLIFDSFALNPSLFILLEFLNNIDIVPKPPSHSLISKNCTNIIQTHKIVYNTTFKGTFLYLAGKRKGKSNKILLGGAWWRFGCHLTKQIQPIPKKPSQSLPNARANIYTHKRYKYPYQRRKF